MRWLHRKKKKYESQYPVYKNDKWQNKKEKNLQKQK